MVVVIYLRVEGGGERSVEEAPSAGRLSTLDEGAAGNDDFEARTAITRKVLDCRLNYLVFSAAADFCYRIFRLSHAGDHVVDNGGSAFIFVNEQRIVDYAEARCIDAVYTAVHGVEGFSSVGTDGLDGIAIGRDASDAGIAVSDIPEDCRDNRAVELRMSVAFHDESVLIERFNLRFRGRLGGRLTFYFNGTRVHDVGLFIWSSAFTRTYGVFFLLGDRLDGFYRGDTVNERNRNFARLLKMFIAGVGVERDFVSIYCRLIEDRRTIGTGGLFIIQSDFAGFVRKLADARMDNFYPARCERKDKLAEEGNTRRIVISYWNEPFGYKGGFAEGCFGGAYWYIHLTLVGAQLEGVYWYRGLSVSFEVV